jgi:hypothetical protein
MKTGVWLKKISAFACICHGHVMPVGFNGGVSSRVTTMTDTTIAPAGRPERKDWPRWPARGVGVIWFSAALLLAPPVSHRIPLRGDSGLLVGITLVLAGVTAGLWVWQRRRGRKSRWLGIKAAWQLGSVLCAWILLPSVWMASGVGLAVAAFYFWPFYGRARVGDQT